MLDLNDLYYFAAVVENRGFAPASRALRVPKSSLSRRIARLEGRLGGRLLERTTRRFVVTEMGQGLYRHCQAMVAEAEAAEEAAASLHDEPRGQVRLSCPPALASQVLAEILPTFLADHPRVRVHVLATNRRVDLIEERIDVAIRVRRRPDAEGSLSVRNLGQGRLILAAGASWIERHGAPDTIEALATLPTIAHLENASDATWTLHGPDGREETIEHAPRVSSGEFSLLLRATVAGLGIALLPEEICREELHAGPIVRVLPEWHGGESYLQLVTTSRRGKLPAVRALVEFLTEAVPWSRGVRSGGRGRVGVDTLRLAGARPNLLREKTEFEREPPR